MKVLLVDSSAPARGILRGLLRDMRITDIAEADDENAAHAIARVFGPDLILLRKGACESTARACLASLRACCHNASILLIVDAGCPSSQAPHLDGGTAGVITRPFTRESLRDRIAHTLTTREAA